MIAVMGATGNTGRGVADRLLARGARVRVIARDARKLQPFVDRGAEAAAGDAADATFLARAFRGADAAYTLIPPDLRADDPRGFQDRLGGAMVRALGDSGVSDVVFLSSQGADLPSGTGPIAGLHAQEERLRTLGGNLLLLRPAYFMENMYANLGLIKHQGINGGAIAPDVRLAVIATRDIAAAAADALATRAFGGIVVRDLLGPHDVTFTEMTRILGETIGTPDLRYVQFSYDEFVKALVQMGISQAVARLFAEMAEAFNEGRIRPVARTPESATPTTFETFAEELARAYREV